MNFVLAFILLFAAASPALAQSIASQTINTIPSANTTFLPDLQNFLRFEDANRFAQQFNGFVVSGGTHGTGASLTQTPTALVAYPGGQYTTESGSIVYANNKTQWVIADSAVSGNSANFTRVAGTHYLLDSTSGSKPSLPANSVWLMEITTSGGSVTVVSDLRTLVPFSQRLKFAELPTAGTPGRLAFVYDVSGGQYYWDNGIAWNSFAPPAALSPVLANWVQNGDFEVWFAGASAAPTSWTLTGSGAAVAKDTTVGHFKVTGAAAQVTSGAGAVAQLYQDVDLITDVGPAARWGGKTVMLGVWVRAVSASIARVGINDGVNATFYSSFHSGNSTLAFLTVTATLTATPTRVRVIMETALGVNVAQFDGVTFGEGQTLTDFLPSSFDQAPALNPLQGGYFVRNLVGQNDGATPNTKFGYSADLVQLRNPVDGSIVVKTNTGTLTNDTGSAGPAANGRDQAGAFAAGNWIHFYFICCPIATESSTTAPSTGPVLPATYTSWAYAGAVRYNGTPLLVKTRWSGARAWYEVSQSALVDGVATVETAISLSTLIPPNAVASLLDLSWAVANRNFHLRLVSGGGDYLLWKNVVSGTTFSVWMERVVPNIAQQVFYLYDTAPAAGTGLHLNVQGYSIPNGGE